MDEKSDSGDVIQQNTKRRKTNFWRRGYAKGPRVSAQFLRNKKNQYGFEHADIGRSGIATTDILQDGPRGWSSVMLFYLGITLGRNMHLDIYLICVPHIQWSYKYLAYETFAIVRTQRIANLTNKRQMTVYLITISFTKYFLHRETTFRNVFSTLKTFPRYHARPRDTRAKCKIKFCTNVSRTYSRLIARNYYATSVTKALVYSKIVTNTLMRIKYKCL